MKKGINKTGKTAETFLVVLRLFLCVVLLLSGVLHGKAQAGDQMLDGIGETGLVARYMFSHDAKDWSRNHLHANMQGQTSFVTDSRFGKVLSLSGQQNSYVTLPKQALADIESLSIACWVNLRSAKAGQRIINFGVDTAHQFFLAIAGEATAPDLLTSLQSGNYNQRVNTPGLPTNKWFHLVLVIDVPSKTFTTYLEGRPAGEAGEIPFDLSSIFDTPGGDGPKLYIGKSIAEDLPVLNALLHDVRIYRVPLTHRQVAGIYNNARGGAGDVAVHERKTEDSRPKFPDTNPQLYHALLAGVSNVEVTTAVGTLPRLPAFVNATYRNSIKGPKARVLWPADTDNSAVLTPGTYTVTGRIAGTHLHPKAIVTVKNNTKATTPVATLETFALSQVTLQNNAHGQQTKFVENRDKFIATLAKTDPNAFLYMFRHAFGQPQPEGAQPLGVWDSKDTKLRGHATGHYLSALAQAYASTGYSKTLQSIFAQKMDYMVNTLYALSKLSGNATQANGPHVADPAAVPVGPGKSTYNSDLSDDGIRTDYWNWGRGFISAYPPDQFIMLEKGAKYGGQQHQVWAPYYTLHKLLAGLVDIYQISGNKKALDIATNMGDWVYARLSRIPSDTLIKMWNTYIAGEYGGMNEAMARLYAITHKPHHLATAKLFDNVRVFFGDTNHSHGLAKNVDLFRGLHANQHIPQIVGSLQVYHASGNAEYYNIADNFWHKVVSDYMYSIGGVAGAHNPANAECFIAQPATLYENGFSAGGQNETCATYNMLKLTANLFQFDQRAALMDYYERGLYNHILASVAEKSAANTYHVPLNPASVKQFSNPDMTGFTCCNGTALESNTKLQHSIYFKSKNNRSLYVNLFVPSTLNWTERGITIDQVTSFPREDQTRLKIKGNGNFTIRVRVPSWATNGFMVTINGRQHAHQAKPGTYIALSRTWRSGDEIVLKMPFSFRLEPVMDQPNIASLFYGPVLLAAQEPEARKDWRTITLDANNIGKTITGDAQQLQFMVDGVVLKPFYESYGRHSVYMDVQLK